MNEYFKKHKLVLALIAFVLIVVVPFVINFLFKLKSSVPIFVAEWDAGDVLSFYGTLLASAATIIGVYATVDYAQKNYRNDERNRTIPYFALSEYSIMCRFDLFLSEDRGTDEKDQTNIYREYKREKVYVVVDENGIKYKTKLTKRELNLIKTNGYAWTQTANGVSLEQEKLLSMPFEAKNIGNGGAVDSRLLFYKEGEDCKVAAPLYSIGKDEKIDFHIFCENKELMNGNNYILELVYGDILGNYYVQKFPMSFGDGENNGPYSSIILNGKQEPLEINEEST